VSKIVAKNIDMLISHVEIQKKIWRTYVKISLGLCLVCHEYGHVQLCVHLQGPQSLAHYVYWLHRASHLPSISSMFYLQIFRTNICFSSLYYVRTTRKSCQNDVRTKNVPVLQWWNWHLKVLFRFGPWQA